jgi:hypothetical protein
MKFSAVAAITNNLVAARFWMILAILFAGMAVASPYFTAIAMRAREKVVILDPGGTLIYAPLLGFEEAGELHAYHVRLACLALSQRNPVGPDLPDLLQRLYLEPAREKAAAMYQAQNPEFKERQVHQKVVTKIDILDTRQIKDGAGHRYAAVTVYTEGNLIRTGTLNLDGTPSETRRAARSFSPRRGDLPCFYCVAARSAAEAGQHARRQPGHSGKELFLQGGHPAALPDPGLAVPTGVRQR